MDVISDMDISDLRDTTHLDHAVMLKGGTMDQAMTRLTGLLKPGDLIFIDRDDWLYRQIAKVTGSWASQVGLCAQDVDGSGKWFVYEGGMPLVRRVELSRFLSRTRDNRFAVRRLTTPLSLDEQALITEAVDRRVGRFNGMSFNYDANQLFGPKLIREVFNEVLGIMPGEIITIADLRQHVSAKALWFWRIWYLGAIPWKRRTCIPHSLYVDPRLQTVFEFF